MAKRVEFVEAGANLELMLVDLALKDDNAIACHDHVEPKLIRIRWGRILSGTYDQICQRREPHRHTKRKTFIPSKSITTAEQPFGHFAGFLCGYFAGTELVSWFGHIHFARAVDAGWFRKIFQARDLTSNRRCQF